MRAIDGDELLGIERLLDTDVARQSKTASWLLDQVLHDIQAMPTLTQPNEWVRRVKEFDELYTKLQIVTGFTAEQLLEMFAAGYTLEKPDYSKHFEAMANLAESGPPNEPRAGLYGKYTVYKNKDGSLVTDCFILRPAKDPAAVAALRAYAAATDNAELSADIINWVGAEPNEPLSIEQLREMNGEPVYIVFLPDIDGEKLQFWALVSVDEWNDVYLANKEGWAFNYEKFLEDVEGIYRRPPEGEEDT